MSNDNFIYLTIMGNSNNIILYFSEVRNMELTIDKRKKELNEQYNLGLSDWDLILWQNLGIQVNDNTKIVEKLKANLDFDLNELYAIAENPNYFGIKIEGNKDLQRAFDGEVKALQARGDESNANYLLSNELAKKQELAEMYGNKQYEEYKHLVGVLKSSNYSDAFKYLILSETLQNTYRMDYSKDKPSLNVNKRVRGQTIHGMMNLPESVLDYIYKNVDKYTGFKAIYKDAQLEYNKLVTMKSGISLDGVNTFDKGQWVKFPSKANDPDNFESNVERLKALVSNTPWCTATLASTHLEGGDFYVFVDNDNQPHIAVKMGGDAIDEVRGIQGGNAQELEPEYRDVALDFLENNKDIKNGIKWLEKEEWNKRLIAYNDAIEKGKYDDINAEQLLLDLFRRDYKAHSGKNSNLIKLKKNISNSSPMQDTLIDGYNKQHNTKYTSGELYFGNMDCLNAKSNVKIVFGNVDFRHSESFDLSGLISISGNADFVGSQVSDLSKLTSVGGHASFGDSQVTDLGSLTSIGGNASFEGSQVTDLSKLTSIGGCAEFACSQVTDLSSLISIGGDAYFKGSQVRDLSKLTSVGGDACFNNSQVTDLSKLTSVGGEIDITNSGIMELPKLREAKKIIMDKNQSIDVSNVQLGRS